MLHEKGIGELLSEVNGSWHFTDAAYPVLRGLAGIERTRRSLAIVHAAILEAERAVARAAGEHALGLSGRRAGVPLEYSRAVADLVGAGATAARLVSLPEGEFRRSVVLRVLALRGGRGALERATGELRRASDCFAEALQRKRSSRRLARDLFGPAAAIVASALLLAERGEMDEPFLRLSLAGWAIGVKRRPPPVLRLVSG